MEKGGRGFGCEELGCAIFPAKEAEESVSLGALRTRIGFYIIV